MANANFKEVLKGLILLETRNIDCFADASTIKAEFAFNEGLKFIGDFIELYTNGDISKEYIDLLIEKAQEK